MTQLRELLRSVTTYLLTYLLTYVLIKHSMYIAVGIAVVCFYHAKHVLSTIAKSFFTSLGRGRCGVKWERGEVGKQSGGERTGAMKVRVRKIGIHFGGYRPISSLL